MLLFAAILSVPVITAATSTNDTHAGCLENCFKDTTTAMPVATVTNIPTNCSFLQNLTECVGVCNSVCEGLLACSPGIAFQHRIADLCEKEKPLCDGSTDGDERYHELAAEAVSLNDKVVETAYTRLHNKDGTAICFDKCSQIMGTDICWSATNHSYTPAAVELYQTVQLTAHYPQIEDFYQNFTDFTMHCGYVYDTNELFPFGLSPEPSSDNPACPFDYSHTNSQL